MRKHTAFPFPGLLALIVLISVAMPAPVLCKPGESIVLRLPAATVLSSLQQMLPLDIPYRSQRLQGAIAVESLDDLTIAENTLTVRGVLTGRHLVFNTQLAGHDIQLRLGEVHLPVTCALQTRFDPAHRRLYITPRFPEASGAGKDDLAPLLGALAGREYRIDLDALEPMHIRVGSRSIPVAMEPIRIVGIDNTLIVHMLPRIGTSR